MLTLPFDVPHPQNTAPVIEFRCLYSTDLKRKQKRWQDGRLKYHTFNKKIMVYDEKSNFIGDAHWREDGDLDEGEELSLERGGTLIQVEDRIGVQAQDLTELVDKRVKEKEARAAARSATIGSPASIPGRTQTFGTPGNTLKLKSLNALLTPSGHHGRALVSTESPYEERQRLNNGNQENTEQEHPSKRRKPNESTQNKCGYAQNLTGTMLTLASSKPSSTPKIRYERLMTNLSGPRNPPIEIDLTADDEGADEPTRTREKIVREAPGDENRKSKVQKTRLRRSPPPKNGYASNLTGVALSLSRPPTASMINRTREPTTKHTHNSRSGDDSSSDSCRYNQRPTHKKTTTYHAKTDDVRDPMSKRRSLSKEKSIEISSSLGEDLTTSYLPVNGKVTKAKSPQAPGMRAVASVKEMWRPDEKVSLAQNPKQRPTISREKITKNRTPPREVTRALSHSFSSNHLISETNVSALEPFARLTADSPKPRSSLKLKSKQPQQMMMLMNRPGPRPSLSNSKTSDNVASKVRKKTTDASKGAGGSEAIDDVDSFVKQQVALLHARLSRKPPQEHPNSGHSFSSLAIDLDAPSAESQAPKQHEKPAKHLKNSSHEEHIQVAPSLAFPSSLLDSGINHHKIDRLLSHGMDRVTLPKKILSSQRVHEATTDDTNNPLQKSPIVQNQLGVEANAIREIQSIMRTTPPDERKDNPSLTSITNMEANLATRTDLSGIPAGGEPAEHSLSTSLAPTKVHRATEESLLSTSLPNVVEEAKVATNTSIVEGREGESAKNQTLDESAVPLAIGPQKLISNAKKRSISKAQRPAENVTEALKNTDEYFRVIVRSSQNLPQTNETIFAARPVEKSQDPDVDRLNKPEKQASNPISPVADLQEPDSAPAVASLDNTGMKPRGGIGFRLTNSFGSKWPAPDLSDTPEFALSIATVNQPKFKLSKPAPRPVTLVSGPEGSSYGRMLRPRSGGKGSDNDMSGGMPVTATGPWSREAFDLFGNWRPPDRPAAT